MGEHIQEAINAARQLIEARSKRIEEINRNWADYANQTTLATNEGEEALQDAYFAEKKEREVPANDSSETEPETYTVVSGDTLGRIANSYDDVSVEDIVQANSSLDSADEIGVGDILIIPNVIPMITEVYYNPTNIVTLGSDTYIVVKGFALQGKEATIQVFEKSPFLLMEAEDTPLTFLEYGSLDPEGDDLINENQTEFKVQFNDQGEAIVKIQLRPKKEDPDTVYLEWQEKFIPKEPEEGMTLPPPTQEEIQIIEPEQPLTFGNGTPGEDVLSPTNQSANFPLPGAKQSLPPIIDFLWLKVEVAGDNGTYERRFPEERGEYFRLEVNKRAPWMEIAIREAKKARGIVEGIEPMYTMAKNYLRFVGNPFEPTSSRNGPWCAAFMNWCMEESGHNYALSASSLAPIHENFDKNFKQIEVPVYGCIVVYANISQWRGHTGFLFGMATNGDYILLGGNQDNSIKLAPYGESIGSKRLYGFYVPADYELGFNDQLTDNDRNIDISRIHTEWGIIPSEDKQEVE
ncbi:LysM peptidoglycan-binding domain-containing protein [Aquimarina latercula]|uniref:LysM peptidoglycan-binding domain-containing protein n=1 Tax=Aquimarina latercula TaxID=987 RepID=UPI00041F0E6E|nr:TIGR02594 family protein [Aquimarina latercula]